MRIRFQQQIVTREYSPVWIWVIQFFVLIEIIEENFRNYLTFLKRERERGGLRKDSFYLLMIYFRNFSIITKIIKINQTIGGASCWKLQDVKMF